MQFQILINIGRTVLSIASFAFFSQLFHLGILKLLFDNFFHFAFGYTISL